MSSVNEANVQEQACTWHQLPIKCVSSPHLTRLQRFGLSAGSAEKRAQTIDKILVFTYVQAVARRAAFKSAARQDVHRTAGEL